MCAIPSLPAARCVFLASVVYCCYAVNLARAENVGGNLPGRNGHVAMTGQKWRNLPMAFLGGRKKESYRYTPLLFFHSTDDLYCKVLDRFLTETVENEMGIPVARLDPFDNENHRKLMQKLEGTMSETVPCLYNRESRQWIRGIAPQDVIRSWARGKIPRRRVSEQELRDRLFPQTAEEGDENEEIYEEGDLGMMEDVDEGEEIDLERKGRMEIERRRNRDARKRSRSSRV